MSNSHTEHVIHGPRYHIDYDKAVGNRRQLLVTDQTANILSNFLAVFLALAAKNLYHIGRRILRAHNERHERSKDISKYGMTGTPTAGVPTPLLAGSVVHRPLGNAIEDTTAATAVVLEATSNVRSATSTSEVDIADAELSPELDEVDQRRTERLEVIDAPDTEAMATSAFGRVFAQLKSFIPIRFLGDNRPLYRRMMTVEFWEAMDKIAKDSSKDLLWHFLVGSGALVLYFGALLLGIMSGNLVVGDSVAISHHPGCGILQFNGSVFDTAQDFALTGQYYLDIARESRQYAKSCYGLANSTNNRDEASSCSFFYHKNIKYSSADNQPCPFRTEDGNLCLDGDNSAYMVTTRSSGAMQRSADTVQVDASALGINSPLQYRFHRSLTCAPLKTEGLVHYVPGVRNESFSFRYFYGNTTHPKSCTAAHPNCTFELILDKNRDRQYTMLSTSTEMSKNDSLWTPIFDVHRDIGETAHLILISNYGIRYPRQTLDPIFFANTTDRDGWYYNDRWHASVLGCMSLTIVCLSGNALPKHAKEVCYNLESLSNLDWTGPEHGPMRAILYHSLALDLEWQVQFLGAESLNAPSLVTSYTSLSIPHDQWKAEVRQMFETLLAFTQIMTRNIARGTPGRQHPNSITTVPPSLRGICTRYKFRSTGWKNISVLGFLADFLAGLIVCSVGITRDNKELWVEKHVKQALKTRVGMFCTDALVKTGNCIAWVARGVWSGVCSICTWYWPYVRDFGTTCHNGWRAAKVCIDAMLGSFRR